MGSIPTGGSAKAQLIGCFPQGQDLAGVAGRRCGTPSTSTLADQLRAEGYPVLEPDVIRLSPYMRRHLNVHGHYSFQLPETAGGRRELSDPGTSDDNDDI